MTTRPTALGSKQADVLAGASHLLEAAAEHETGERQAPVGERRAVGVLENDLVAAVLSRGFDEARIERGAGADGIECLRHRNVLAAAGWRMFCPL